MKEEIFDKIDEAAMQDLFGFDMPTEQQLSTIAVWAQSALEKRAYINQAEEQLKHLKKELSIIEDINLPQAMMEAGLSEFKMRNGAKITIKDVIRGALSKDIEKRQNTFDWVIENGGQDIIKNHFEIDYSKGQYDESKKLRSILQEYKIHFDEFESIHTQTLWSFLREKVKEGTIPPFDDMGLMYLKTADIKPPKA